MSVLCASPRPMSSSSLSLSFDRLLHIQEFFSSLLAPVFTDSVSIERQKIIANHGTSESKEIFIFSQMLSSL